MQLIHKFMQNICKIEGCRSLVGIVTELDAVGRQFEPYVTNFGFKEYKNSEGSILSCDLTPANGSITFQLAQVEAGRFQFQSCFTLTGPLLNEEFQSVLSTVSYITWYVGCYISWHIALILIPCDQQWAPWTTRSPLEPTALWKAVAPSNFEGLRLHKYKQGLASISSQCAVSQRDGSYYCWRERHLLNGPTFSICLQGCALQTWNLAPSQPGWSWDRCC